MRLVTCGAGVREGGKKCWGHQPGVEEEKNWTGLRQSERERKGKARNALRRKDVI